MKPEDFNKLVENLKTQDPRCTADPLFCVEQRTRTYGLNPSHHYDGFIWINQNDTEVNFDSDEELRTYLIENGDDLLDALKGDPSYDGYDSPDTIDDEALDELFMEAGISLDADDEFTLGNDSFERCYYEEYYVFVNTHFTEAAALLFIAQNKHNLTEPRTYVTSQYRCWEWNALREALMSGQLVLKEGT